MKHRPPRHAPRGPAPSRPPRSPWPAATHGSPPDVANAEPVFGLRAALALFARRPDDVLRVAYAPRAVPPHGRADLEDALDRAAARGIACEALPDAELARLAESDHHEGLCVLARARRWASMHDLADALLAPRAAGAAVALDRVRNPYNVGAILRSAAFFGLDAALLGTPAPHPGLPPTAVRVAEGGAEHLLLARTTDLADTLGRLRSRGIHVVGADGEAPASAIGFPFARPTVLVLGNEREGMHERVRAQCDAIVSIPGSGAVESLNVAVAAGLLVAEVARARLTAPVPSAAPPHADAPRRRPR